MQLSMEGKKDDGKRIRFPDGKDPIRDQILGCTSCELYDRGLGPVPFSGVVGSRVCVVGEAPGKYEDSKGGPFLGPAGRLLRNELRANKVRPERLFYCNIVSCFPRLDGAKTPKVKHINACHSNCWAQIEHSGAEWVLVVGGLALKALAPWLVWKGIEKTITVMRQYTWYYKGKYWCPIIHPAAALRQESKYRPMFKEDIRSFVEQVRTSVPKVREFCYECERPVEVYDEWGQAWCSHHDPRIRTDAGLRAR